MFSRKQAALALLLTVTLHAQTPTEKAAAAPSPVERKHVGDAPADPGPLATDVSPALTHKAIRATMSKVAAWQIKQSEQYFNAQWTFAALYDGLLASSATTGDPIPRASVVKFAESQHWKLLNDRFPHADDMALGKAYLDIYLSEPKPEQKPEQIADTKRVLDLLLARTDDPKKDLWWWCDALYMAPPVLARMYVITGDRKYLDFMDREWDITTGHLFNPTEHLYFRDSRYFTQHETNGKPLFWSRGNGWVMGSLALILEVLPKDDAHRTAYIAKLKEMSAALAAIQSPDGLWRSGLLDPDSYGQPEVSGSAFFLYGMAYGVNNGILDRKTYLPVIERGWSAIVTHHIYADGRLGSIQPIDAQPGKYPPSASYVYGVGGFLLAGSEIDKLARK